MKSKMMKLTTKVTAAIMVASALVTSASPALVKANDSVVITESAGTEETTVESEVVVEEPVAEEVVTEEPVAEEVVTEEPVAEEVVTEEPVAEEVVTEEPVAEEVVTEEPVAEETVTEEVVTEDAAVTEEVAEETVEKVALVEFVDEGYEEVPVDPEVEKVVAEVESNMMEAKDNANGDANDIIEFLQACDSLDVAMLASDNLSLEEIQDKQDKEEEKNGDAKTKEEQEASISEAGAIAGNFAADLSSIDFNEDDAVEQATVLTFKTINENLIAKIPYVGGFISAILGGVLPGNSGDAAKSDPYSDILEKISEQMDDVKNTIQRATQKHMDADQIQNLKNNFQKVEDTARTLQKKYRYNNSEYKAVIESLNNGDEIYDYADEVFKGIYDVNSDKKPYFDAYLDFADSSMNFSSLVPGVTATDVLSTYDLINYTGKQENTKYLFNDERKTLTDRVENTLDVGYSVLRFCMELELAKQDNLKNACNEQLKELKGDQKDVVGGRKAELTEEAKNLEQKNKELAENFETSTDDEKKSINEQINDNNEKISAINKEIAAINVKISEIQTIKARCNSAIEKIKVDTDELNEKKAAANARISIQRKSILEGYKYLAENADQKEEINVYFDKVKALEFNHNGKVVIAYPKFDGGDSRVEYVDKYGNLWAHQDVSYGDAGKKLDTGSKVLFGFYSLATSINPNLVGEKAVIYEGLELRGGMAHKVTVLYDGMENKQSVSVPMDWVYSIRSYQLKGITNEF